MCSKGLMYNVKAACKEIIHCSVKELVEDINSNNWSWSKAYLFHIEFLNFGAVKDICDRVVLLGKYITCAEDIIDTINNNSSKVAVSFITEADMSNNIQAAPNSIRTH